MAKKGNYSELLRDPRWQRLRLTILERDGWKCRNCSASDKTLAVHHLYYAKGKNPWEYEPEYLMTLCEECHDTEYHERSHLEEVLLESLKIRGWLCMDLELLTAAIDQRKITPGIAFNMTLADIPNEKREPPPQD